MMVVMKYNENISISSNFETGIGMSTSTMSQLLHILAYFHYSCPAPIYFVYSLVSIYQIFTRFIGQCPA